MLFGLGLGDNVVGPDALVADLGGEVDGLALALLLVVGPVALEDLVGVEVDELAPAVSLAVVVLALEDQLLLEVLQLAVALEESALELTAVVELVALHDPAPVRRALHEVPLVGLVLLGEEVLALAVHLPLLPVALVDVSAGLEDHLAEAVFDSLAEVAIVDTARAVRHLALAADDSLLPRALVDVPVPEYLFALAVLDPGCLVLERPLVDVPHVVKHRLVLIGLLHLLLQELD